MLFSFKNTFCSAFFIFIGAANLQAEERVALIACHGGPAQHFVRFAEEFQNQGYAVDVYGTGPADATFQKSGLLHVHSFSLSGKSEEEVAQELAEACKTAALVMTDLGHPFDVKLQEVLQNTLSLERCYVYYDNLEAYVPGGYSQVAAKVLQVAKRVLFANAELAGQPLFYDTEEDGEKRLMETSHLMRIGIGYYPFEQGERIQTRREKEHRFWKERFVPDDTKTLLVYAGGNNHAYFEKDFPKFLKYLETSMQTEDLSRYVILLQRHPGAIQGEGNSLDQEQVKTFLDNHRENPHCPQWIVSEKGSSSEDAFVAADRVIYAQTSMAPALVMANVPLIQVADERNNDCVVRAQACLVVQNAEDLRRIFQELPYLGDKKALCAQMGQRADWQDNLMEETCCDGSR